MISICSISIGINDHSGLPDPLQEWECHRCIPALLPTPKENHCQICFVVHHPIQQVPEQNSGTCTNVGCILTFHQAGFTNSMETVSSSNFARTFLLKRQLRPTVWRGCITKCLCWTWNFLQIYAQLNVSVFMPKGTTTCYAVRPLSSVNNFIRIRRNSMSQIIDIRNTKAPVIVSGIPHYYPLPMVPGIRMSMREWVQPTWTRDNKILVRIVPRWIGLHILQKKKQINWWRIYLNRNSIQLLSNW